MFDIWSEKLRGRALPEYKSGNVRIYAGTRESEYCYVFCSSNDIWYPNTQQAYEENIVKRDRYEWTNYSPLNTRKRIYIRDIYKSWYVTGVNQNIDSIDKLVDFIAKESNGLKLVCVGSSSGGYLAVLLGCLLHADHVLCFSAQMELNNQWAIEKNGLLQNYKNDLERSRYYDLRPYIENNNTPIYYVVPIKCEQDRHHYDHVSSCQNIRSFCFKSKHHGVVVSKCNLPQLIDSSKEELEHLYSKYAGEMISIIMFSVNLVGLRRTIMGIVNDSIKQIKCKLRS